MPKPQSNGGVGAYACHYGWHIHGRYRACEIVGSVARASGSDEMELMAIVRGLAALDRPCGVTLYSDSQTIISCLKGNIDWMSNASWPKWAANNSALTNELFRLLRIHTVSFHWIKGHSKSQGNRRCDRLAKMSARSRLRSMAKAGCKPKPQVVSDGYYCCRHYQCVGKHDTTCPNYRYLLPVVSQESMPVWQL